MNSGHKISHNEDEALVFLHVRDIAGLKKFYVETLGFNSTSDSGVHSNILLLESKPTLQLELSVASPKKVSLRIALPNRRELAKVIGRLCTMNHTNTRLDFPDRQLTRLRDPEGNDIEFFVLKNVNDNSGEKPLDIEALFNELQPDDRLCDKLPASAELVIEEA
jgi:catechol-2,3-dioxygenase